MKWLKEKLNREQKLKFNFLIFNEEICIDFGVIALGLQNANEQQTDSNQTPFEFDYCLINDSFYVYEDVTKLDNSQIEYI